MAKTLIFLRIRYHGKSRQDFRLISPPKLLASFATVFFTGSRTFGSHFFGSLFFYWLLGGLLIWSTAIVRAESPSTTQTSIGGIQFSLAPGWEIEKIASAELTHWPMIADWDSQGRLVIAESAGVARPIEEHNKQQLHKIIRLVDTNHDGVFDRRVVAVDKVAFPEGVLCLGDDILVAAPPQIWKFSDRDGDGVCEHREVWFDGETITGCANDLHGPYLGRDGWIYWTKGAFAEQEREWLDGRKLKSTAAHVFRRRLEGGQIQPLISGGMDNPVEVAFLPEGEKLFTSTFLQHPADGLRDGIAHAVYGGVHGKTSDSLSILSPTGPLMPITIPLGPAAPSGLLVLESAPQPTLVAALFNLQKVTAYELTHIGSTFQSTATDLVVADRVDFHPTDVIEDADGSLIVIDTGGWYDLCCPTSRIDQTTASGGIYRLRKTAQPAPALNSESINVAGLDAVQTVDAFFDPRPWVHREALLNLHRFPESVGLLAERIQDPRAVWGLCVVGDSKAMEQVTEILRTPRDYLVSTVQAALHAIAVQGHQPEIDQVAAFLRHPEPRLRRVAAEAIGRIGDESQLSDLLTMLDAADVDRHLEHSILYAVIEIGRRGSFERLLALHDQATSEPQRYGTLLVLDRMESASTIRSESLFLLIESFAGDPASKDKQRSALLAAEILAKQPERATGAKENLDELWAGLRASPASAELLASILRGWRNSPGTLDWIRNRLANVNELSPNQVGFLVNGLDQFIPQTMPSGWLPDLIRWLEHSEDSLQAAVAETAARIEMTADDRLEFSLALISATLAADDTMNQMRLLATCPRIETTSLSGSREALAQLEATVIDALLSDDRSLGLAASRALPKLSLSDDGAGRIRAALSNLSLDVLQPSIQALYQSSTTGSRTELLTRLRAVSIAKTLPAGFLETLAANDTAALRTLAADVAEELSRSPVDLASAVSSMLANLPDGDAVRGLQVFRSQRAACAGCHRMGYVGGLVGPDLTRIGASRTSEALLEAILAPSARLEQSYRSTQVLTADGRLINGLIEARDGDSLKLRTAAETVVTVDRDEIELEQPSDISVMPTGLAEQLSIQELADLLQFLRSAK